MTIKYLAGNRRQGTRAERFPSLKSTGISLTGCLAYYKFKNSYVNDATEGFPNGLGSTANGQASQANYSPAGSVHFLHSDNKATIDESVSGNGGLRISSPATNKGAVIDLGDDMISGTGNFGVSLWIKPRGNLSSFRSFISNYNTDGSNTGGFEYYLNNSNNVTKYYHSGGSVNGSVSLTTNVWSHLALIRTSGTVAIYVNGVLDNSGSSSSSIAGSNMQLGGQSTTSECFDGDISEVSIWNRALTAAEITSLSTIRNETIFDETDTGKSYIWNATTETYDHVGDSSNTSFLDLSSSTNRFSIIKLTTSSPAIGTSIKKIKMSLSKNGTPTGTAYIRVWDNNDNVVASMPFTPNSLLTTSQATYEFTLPRVISLGLDYKVGLEYGSGAGSNYIKSWFNIATIETGYLYGSTSLNHNLTSKNILITFDSSPTNYGWTEIT